MASLYLYKQKMCIRDSIYIDALIYGYRKHIGAATSGRKDYNNDLKLIINHLYLIDVYKRQIDCGI